MTATTSPHFLSTIPIKFHPAHGMADKKSQKFELRDGRILGYAEFGSPDGAPIIMSHGFPGSRLDWDIVDPEGAITSEIGARIIAIDRPGMGLSTFQPGRTMVDWPDDVLELADGLGLGVFGLLGFSGGGPYAAACAAKIPRDRLTTLAIVCGMGPADAPGATEGMSWYFPGKWSWSRAIMLFASSMGLKDPDRFMASTLGMLPEPDRELLKKPQHRDAYLATVNESFREGIWGVHLDAKLYTLPQGAHSSVPKDLPVHLWHGEKDVNVLPSVARHVAQLLPPSCIVHMFKDEAHLTLPHTQLKAILGSVLKKEATS